jgi:hypothetical protein
LYRGVDFSGKLRRVNCAASGAGFALGLILGNMETNRRNINDLSLNNRAGGDVFEELLAVANLRRWEHDERVRLGHLGEGVAWMAGLAANLAFAVRRAQRVGAPEAIARGRLAAV